MTEARGYLIALLAMVALDIVNPFTRVAAASFVVVLVCDLVIEYLDRRADAER